MQCKGWQFKSFKTNVLYGGKETVALVLFRGRMSRCGYRRALRPHVELRSVLIDNENCLDKLCPEQVMVIKRTCMSLIRGR